VSRVLLIVGGGIAAYKACELVRLFRRRGIAVRCVLTEGARHFVTPMTLAALSSDKVYHDLWDLKDEAEMGHIQLSREADLIVVAPATADLMARMAGGLADDLATTLLLATDKPVLAAPAMNVRMWLHPATRRNVERLRADGVTVMVPDEGDMACGEWGPGRLPEPEAIAAAAERMLAPAPRPLAGRRVLVTAGPTHEPLDAVRYLANRSSGRQGYALAEAAARAGAEVLLISGPVTLPAPPGVRHASVETATDMMAAVEAAPRADIAFLVAAVADWRPAHATRAKIKKNGPPPPLELTENPDILARLAVAGPLRPRLVIGFAAETDDVAANARAKLRRKGCDWIVANDVSGDVMGGTNNTVLLVTADGTEAWERMPKEEVARRLVERAARALGAVE